MNFSASLLAFITLLNTYYSIIHAEDLFPALTLVHNGLEFDDITEMKNKDSFKLIILACPAQQKLPDEIADWQTERSLVVEQIYKASFEIRSNRICKEKYAPNVSFEYSMKSFMFGYKLYFTDEKLKIMSTVIKKDIEEMNNFFWYIVMSIDILPKSSLMSVHEVEANNFESNLKQDVENCENFNLGISLIKNKNIAQVYEKENQIAILNTFVRPHNLNEKEIDELYYLIKQQLSPISDFYSRSKRLVTCSYLNTAPMWKTIADGWWKNVQEFIQTQAIYTSIEVTTGTYGVLQLTQSEFPNQLKSVFLNNIPVPEVYWKLIKRVIKDDPIPSIKEGILIFTLNYVLEIALHTPFCTESVCKKLGWEVENENYRTGYTYCCRVEKNILRKLGIDGDIQKLGEFNLGESPVP